MTSLIERIEAATGPDRELDFAIWFSVFADEKSIAAYNAGLEISDSEAKFRADYMLGGFRPTSSIDAALTLVPDGLYPTIDFVTKRVWLRTAEGYDTPNGPAYGFAQSVPTSICAASLRAREASHEG